MKHFICLTLFSSTILAGCMEKSSALNVRITPESYSVNNITSELATPAVNEVVRIKPKAVLMLICEGTPNAKIIQFERELRAQYMSRLQGTRATDGCPS